MILLTGGSGRLGTELQKLGNFDAPLRSRFDILFDNLPKNTELIVHCAAFTYVEGADYDHSACWNINVFGTERLASFDVPILYISTEHIFDGERGDYKEWDIPNPANYYALTKLCGECVLNARSKIIRTSLKARPFPYPKAFVDQWTSGDYVDKIAEEIILAINNFDKLPKIINVGTNRKSIYELAKQTKQDVIPISRLENVKTKSPKDTSLNLDRWLRFKKGLKGVA